MISFCLHNNKYQYGSKLHILPTIILWLLHNSHTKQNKQTKEKKKKKKKRPVYNQQILQKNGPSTVAEKWKDKKHKYQQGQSGTEVEDQKSRQERGIKWQPWDSICWQEEDIKYP